MKTELCYVTPAQARKWLEGNRENRPLRPGAVEGLHLIYGRGEWKVTHQGIGISKTGRLLDGQHRLTFISQLPEGTKIPVNVTTGMDEDTFGAIDQGMKRTASDVLGVCSELVAVGRFFARMASGDGARGVSVIFTEPFVQWVTPEYEELLTYCPSKARIWSSAAVRSAAVYQMKRGHDADFIKLSYWSLVHADIDSMPHASRALMSQHMSGKIVSARTNDLFCRALRAFDSRKQGGSGRILIRDQAATLEEVRKYVLTEMAKKGPAKAGPMVAKPGSNSKAGKAMAA